LNNLTKMIKKVLKIMTWCE